MGDVITVMEIKIFDSVPRNKSPTDTGYWELVPL